MLKKWKRTRHVAPAEIRKIAEYFRKYYKCVQQRGRPKDPKKALVPRLQEHFGVSRRTVMRALAGEETQKKYTKKEVLTEVPVTRSPSTPTVPLSYSTQLAQAFAQAPMPAFKKLPAASKIMYEELVTLLDRVLIDPGFAFTSEGSIAQVLRAKLKRLQR